MKTWNFVRKSAYHDSVTLMRVSRELEAVPGVARAAAMMGTPQNLDILRGAGLLAAEGERAAPADLVVAVAAETADAAEAARAAADAALALRRPGGAPAAARPRTLAGALRAMPEATLALVSVPGLYAGAEAEKALGAGLHVMLFSDNVPVETEVALKQRAVARDLFLLGPDCGSAIVNGVPLGFANAVPRGRIGVAAASGTGLQEITCLVAAVGEGVSHAIGVGGRDLSDAVGGLMMRPVLAALAADAATEVIVVVGKPPGPRVAADLVARARELGPPCVLAFVGEPLTVVTGGAARAVGSGSGTLEDAALAAVALARGQEPRPAPFTLSADEVERLVRDGAARLGPRQRFVRGLYAGGTLAHEAVTLLSAALPGVSPGVHGDGAGHCVVDLGDDRFTVGRPHPMIDGSVRREWIAREGRDPATAVLLLDVVLGYGAHADPAGELVPALAALRRERDVVVVASVCGTDADAPPRAAQAAALRAAGVLVMPSNAQAARLAACIAARAAGSA